ncbi:unnamed protein product [Adineta ricciae]|uniref:Uncharacterized protein n=1 Tax=Adineta ricciae TaxID=249248 RepID=A0A815DEZ4_ADIRI|nr:unnamed protein product [Adineta ricciae]CAF1296111.1 unnamed protein product [Adineta ricciae]
MRSTQRASARHCVGIDKIQNVLVVWLDNNINNSSTDCRNTTSQLQRAIHDLHIYKDCDACIDFIETIEDRKICLITSGSLGQQILSRVHDMSQIDSIFVFCGNRQRHEQWTGEWPKIKGLFTDIKSISDALKQAVRQCEQNAISISFVTSDKRLNQLDPSFMYTQIFKEILLTIKFDDIYMKQYANYCREVFAGNKAELKNIKRFKRKYHRKTPIWWYTLESFLYPMLNRAIRLMIGDILTRMGFFINDLHQQIQRLHQEQNITEIFTVYRGQGLSKDDFEQLQQNKRGIMSFNNFLSTSRFYDIAFHFARKNANNPHLMGIVFVMEINPTQSTISFASVRNISAIAREDEVLFSMHSVFRIDDVKQIGENARIFEVHLTLTNDKDKQLNELTEHMREESFPDEDGWYRMGLLLERVGQNNKAEEVYQMLLDRETKKSGKALIYNQLGSIEYNRGEYQKAIVYYEKSLAINENSLSSTDPELAKSYNNIGNVYFNVGDHRRALQSHEKALAILQQALVPNHPTLASLYNNIGAVYSMTGDCGKALSYYEKALAIQQQSLPPTHPHLAMSHTNIANMYNTMCDYRKALASHEKSLYFNNNRFH